MARPVMDWFDENWFSPELSQVWGTHPTGVAPLDVASSVVPLHAFGAVITPIVEETHESN